MSKIQQKIWYTLTGFALMLGNIISNSMKFPKIGLFFGIIGLYYFLRALMIRPDKGDL